MYFQDSCHKMVLILYFPRYAHLIKLLPWVVVCLLDPVFLFLLYLFPPDDSLLALHSLNKNYCFAVVCQILVQLTFSNYWIAHAFPPNSSILWWPNCLESRHSVKFCQILLAICLWLSLYFTVLLWYYLLSNWLIPS